MEYSINQLGKMAGVSTRTLRYYDELGLLKPLRINSSGYRIYGKKQVDTLQQILFYRELSVALEDIRKIITSPNFDKVQTLDNHLSLLLLRQKQITQLIANVKNTILASKGEIIMQDKEKFEGFKEKLIEENEAQYGEEIRQKYGAEKIDASNKKVKSMTKDQFEAAEKLSAELNEALKSAFLQGDPTSNEAQMVCKLHKQWLCVYWSSYTKEAHMGLCEMYVSDPRFTAYYNKIAVGSAEFLRDAMAIFCK